MNHLRPLTEGNVYRFAARSRTALIQAASFFPARSAAAVYRSRRSVDSRSSYRSVSPLSRGGLPLGRFAGIGSGLLFDDLLVQPAQIHVAAGHGFAHLPQPLYPALPKLAQQFDVFHDASYVGRIMPVQIIVDKPPAQVFTVRTLNQEASMKTPTNIQVQTSGIDSKKAAASWELDGARYHVWFDLKTKEIATDFRTGRNASEGTVYKNPLMEDRNHPDFFNTRKLDASAHVGIIGQVFEEIEAKGLIAKALAAEEEKERQRQAESKEYRRQEKIKEAALVLLAEVRAVANGATRTKHCQALLRALGEAE